MRQITRNELRPAALAALFAVLASTTLASEIQYLKKSEQFCDSSGVLCLFGKLTYRPNSRLVSLNARVQKQTGPGTVHIILTGSNRQDMLRRTEIRLEIRGTHSEIIDHQMVPDAPDVYEWELSSFKFEADDN